MALWALSSGRGVISVCNRKPQPPDFIVSHESLARNRLDARRGAKGSSRDEPPLTR
jgi:hypothetical protein